MRVALLQMVSSQNVETNLRFIEDAFQHLADAEAVFLPENFAALGHSNPYQIGALETDSNGPIRSRLSTLAHRHSVWIFAGTLPIANRPNGEPTKQNQVRAASLVINPEGLEVARYDKMHMFDVVVDDDQRSYRESDTFEHGQHQQCIDLPQTRVGLSVCYDIRFSEFYLNLFKQGAEVIAIPSAFTEPTGEAHFEVLMRARAIESFSYTIAACQGGVHDSGRKTFGNSMVVSPWGEVIAQAGKGEDLIIVDLDLAKVREARKKMPVLDQRRL